MADAALQAGGRVVGVIPQQLAHREVAHVPPGVELEAGVRAVYTEVLQQVCAVR